MSIEADLNLTSETMAGDELLNHRASKRRKSNVILDYTKQMEQTNFNNNYKRVPFQISASSTLIQPNALYPRYSSSQLSPTSMKWIMESLFGEEESATPNQDEIHTDSKQKECMHKKISATSPSRVLVPNENVSKCVRWNVNEDSKLFDLHKQHGNSWAVIANDLPGRSRLDVKTRYRSLCRAAKRFWSQKQDALLLSLYVQCGNAWNDSIALSFPNRSKTCIKNRFK